MTGQIRFAAEGLTKANSLAIHRVREAHEDNAGGPGCGDPCRPWKGLPATFVHIGKGDPLAGEPVNCGRNGCRA